MGRWSEQRPRPFIQDGVSDSKWSAPIPVVEPIRPPQMSGRQRSRYGLRGVRVGEASHPGPAAIQETLIDSLEFDLTRVESGVGTTTTQFENGVECSLEKVVSAEDSESDTESLARGEASIQCQRRRLRLTWADEQEVPDSHEERLARVRSSATVSVRDKRWRSAPGQFQLWRWMQTTVRMAASRSSQRLSDAIIERHAEETRAFCSPLS